MPEADLLVTKFTALPVRSALLHRSRLLAMLDQSRLAPLTVLSAPAGFGKTTLLSAWTGQQPANSVAWLSLDEQDNDPTRFWTYVIAALRQSGPRLASVGSAALTLLHSPQPSLLTSVLTSLINELAALDLDIVLILDDYHVIAEQTLHEALLFLLDHLPACLHLVLASRSDPSLPLARLRMRGQLLEIREADLRMDSEEVENFLSRVMHLSLDEQDRQLLERRTEGWIAGLQLAALSMRRHSDASAFVRAFTGSQRFILDYVQDEILTPLLESRQRFLLYTSVLERMNAELCQALTGERDSQQILEDLERANLFLIPLDEERRWYRFHTLFREVLLARLQTREPEQIVRLHREAALWYKRQGWPHEALPHALATRDMPFVAELLESCMDLLSRQGELQTLLAWIKLLPLETLRVHPRLATSYILAFHVLFPFSTQQQQERAYLQQLRAGVEWLIQSDEVLPLSESERKRFRHRLTVLDSWELVAEVLSEGNVERLNRLVEQVGALPEDDDPLWTQNATAPFGIIWRMQGNFPPMATGLQEVWEQAHIAKNHYLETQVLWGLIIALMALGRLSQAREYCDILRELMTMLGGPLPVAAYPDVFQAQFAYHENQLALAKSKALTAIEKTAPLQYMDILIMAYEVLVHICIAQGNLSEAEHILSEMKQIDRRVKIPLFRPWIEGLQGQLWLAQGNLDRARDWAEHTPCRSKIHAYTHEITSLTLARIFLADRQYAQALLLLSELLHAAEQVSRVGSIIPVLTLQASVLQASGHIQEALKVLDRLLSLAEPEKYLRVFLDAGEPMYAALRAWLKSSPQATSPVLAPYVHTLLACFEAERRLPAQQEQALSNSASSSLPASSQSIHSPVELLTPREVEVLYLLAEGASNQDIAKHLVISLATAKKHVTSILGKLEAENRTQAIARARARALL